MSGEPIYWPPHSPDIDWEALCAHQFEQDPEWRNVGTCRHPVMEPILYPPGHPQHSRSLLLSQLGAEYYFSHGTPMESEPTLLQFRSLDSLIAERERHQFNQRNQQIQLNQHSQSPTSMNTTSEISDTIVPWWEDPMTDELRQLLYLDHRCFYCRAKCDSKIGRAHV